MEILQCLDHQCSYASTLYSNNRDKIKFQSRITNFSKDKMIIIGDWSLCVDHGTLYSKYCILVPAVSQWRMPSLLYFEEYGLFATNICSRHRRRQMEFSG